MTGFGIVQLRAARVLHADPPWKFKDKLPGKTRGASRLYPCMTVEQIVRLELPPLHDDSLLLLWRVAAMQQEALDVMKAWGFRLGGEIVWSKLTRRGNPFFGMGRVVRGAHEVCLIGVRGRFKVRDRSVRSEFSAPVGRHSEKPAEIFRIAQRLSAGPYTEMFGRTPRPGWQVLGNDQALLWNALQQRNLDETRVEKRRGTRRDPGVLRATDDDRAGLAGGDVQQRAAAGT